MERFSNGDFEIEDLPEKWTVSCWDSRDEETKDLDVQYWELVHFTKHHYDFTKKEAIDHLNRCGEDETENLLKLYFIKKHNNG